ncbi:MAG: lipopolysaccharide biosynthesis protein [Actinomycetota bacterium]|nr:lipopolysaccharide biosynthesis protein [Actinomycetota bacterium]
MIAQQIKRLTQQSAIYGLGGLVSRVIAVLLLPLYTHYLSGRDYGRVETLIALNAILVALLRLGITSAFFRFYFDHPDDERKRVTVVRTSFWFTMAMATVGLAAGWLLAPEIAAALNLGHGQAWLVRASFVALWAQMNYEQLTSLFRVEQRPVLFSVATIANLLITVAATVVLVVGFHERAMGVVVGNTIGTLAVFFVLLAYRRYQLGLEFDRNLFRAMNRFGMPLVPAQIAIWALNFGDRFFLAKLKGQAEVGHYSIGARIASTVVLALTAFRMAWPAFAYSIEDEDEAKRTYGFVLTYVVFATCWMTVALGLLAPWLVRLLASRSEFYSGARVVSLLCFQAAAWGAFNVVVIGIGRARRTQFNWVVTGIAAIVSIGLNLLLVPPYGMIGAAISGAAAFALMFLLMAVHAQRIYPVPYQWRRVALLFGAAVGLTVLGKQLDVPLAVAILLALSYPLVLLPLGFYLPAERRRLRRLFPAPR